MVLGLFGKNKSSKETTIENIVVNSTTFNVLNRTENVSSSRIISKQNIDINGATFICKNANMNQIANLDVKVMAKFEGKDAAKLVDNIMNVLDSKLDEELKQASGFLGIGGGNESKMKTNVKTSVTNDLKKNITNETINKLASEIAVGQKLKVQNLIVDPCGKGPGLKIAEKLMEEGKLSFKDFMASTADACDAECGEIDQDVQIKFVSEQVASKINETIAENKTVQQLKQDIASKQEQEQTGIGGAVAKGAKGIGEGVGTAAKGAGEGVGTAAEGVGKGVGNVFSAGSAPSIASAVVSCIMVIAAGAFAMSPAGQNAVKSAGKGR
tara:strand:+ start:4367 stop:5344 length:978 start_codon:yes stop_codon:yes gene_type:complete